MGLLDRLQTELGYRFRDSALLQEALTHRSAGSRNNERLEFLGDGVLNFVIGAELFERFPSASEGDLSRLRASLVKGDQLARLARQMELGDYLTLGSGELKSGGFRRASILADALEAIMGAVYRDGGFAAAAALILDLYRDALDSVHEAGAIKDPKTRLQELLQSRKLPLPEYAIVSVSGESHNQSFTVACRVTGLETEALGQGASRRKAEQDAARHALGMLEHD
jgi:ribonuclease-3